MFIGINGVLGVQCVIDLIEQNWLNMIWNVMDYLHARPESLEYEWGYSWSCLLSLDKLEKHVIYRDATTPSDIDVTIIIGHVNLGKNKSSISFS